MTFYFTTQIKALARVVVVVETLEQTQWYKINNNSVRNEQKGIYRSVRKNVPR